MPAGSTSVTFTITTFTVTSTSSVNVTVSYAGALRVAVLTVLPSPGGGVGWYNSAWQYRSAVTITNATGGTLSNFQVRVGLGSGFPFGNARADGADVRFTSADGVTLIPFWVEEWNPQAGTASIWVRVPSIPSAGATVYLYFGNATASSASNGSSTFEFFDDFNGGVIDATKWTASGGSWAVLSGTQQDGTTGGVAQGTTTGRQILYSSYSGTDYVVDAYGQQSGGRLLGLGVRVNGANNLYSINLYEDLDSANNLYLYSWVNNATGNATATLGAAATGSVNLNQWNRLTVKVQGTGINVYRDGVLRIQASNSSLATGGIALYGETNTVARWNNIVVRKYASMEPAATVGAPSSQ